MMFSMTWMSKGSNCSGLSISVQLKKSLCDGVQLRELIVLGSMKAPCMAPAGVAKATDIRATLGLYDLAAGL